MNLFGIINQTKNFFSSIWASKNWKSAIIYTIVFVVIFFYASRTLNSMIRRDRITLPPVIEEVIAVMYAEENKLYAERMLARQQQQQAQQKSQQGNVQREGDRQNPQQGSVQQQQQVENRGGRKTTYSPLNALVIIVQLLSMSAICCLIIFLIYRRFTLDTIPPLPILSSKGKLNEEQ